MILPGDDFECEFVSDCGGRLCNNVNVVVNYVNGRFAGELDIGHNFYNSQDLSQLFILRHHLLKIGYFYNVILRACTFSGACGVSSHQFSVSNTSGSLSVTLHSPDTVSVAHDFIVEAYANVKHLDTPIQNPSFINYTWSVYENDDLQPHLGSKSDSSSIFYLKPFSLAPEKMYKVVVSVYHRLYGWTSIARRLIYTKRGNLVAISDSPAEITLHVNDQRTIDYADSYDEDVKQNTIFTYHWQCKHIWPYQDYDGCKHLIFLYSESSITVSVHNSSKSSIQNYQYQILCTITADTRMAQTITKLTIGPPAFNVMESFTRTRLGGHNEIIIVSINSTKSGSANVTGIGYNAVEAEVSPFVFAWTSTNVGAQTLRYFTMILNPMYLPQDMYSYCLTLKSDDGLIISRSVIVVDAHPAPLPGSMTVNPKNGTEMVTTFTLSVSGFMCRELPCRFTFYDCYSTSGISSCKSINSLSRVSSNLQTKLGAGMPVVVGVWIVDSLMASSTISNNVTVIANPNFTLAKIISVLDNGTDVDNLDVWISDAMNVLKKVDISGVGNCRELNRENCGIMSHRCGPCLEGFQGQWGPSNTVCYSDYLKSNKNIIAPYDPAKGNNKYTSLVGNCDSRCRGSCELFSYQSTVINGSLRNNCNVLDNNCQARCVCDDGFEGPDCDQLKSDFEVTDIHVQIYLGSVGKQIEHQRRFRSTVLKWLKGLSSVSQHSSNLSESSKELLVKLALKALQIARENVNLSYQDVKEDVEKILDLTWLFPLNSLHMEWTCIKSYFFIIMKDSCLMIL
jgi:hypothetical protein